MNELERFIKTGLVLLWANFFFSFSVQAKVCFLDDPDCREDVEYSLPNNCDDNYKTKEECEASSSSWVSDTSKCCELPGQTDRCLCRKKNCDDVSDVYKYKTDADCPESGQIIDRDISNKFVEGACWSKCMCPKGWFEKKEDVCTDNKIAVYEGGSCTMGSVVYYEKMNCRCPPTYFICENGGSLDASECVEIDGTTKFDKCRPSPNMPVDPNGCKPGEVDLDTHWCGEAMKCLVSPK